MSVSQTLPWYITPLPNARWLTAVNAAGNALINVLEVDASDDTWLNADTGDQIRFGIAGTAIINLTSTVFAPQTQGIIELGQPTLPFLDLYWGNTTRTGLLAQSAGNGTITIGSTTNTPIEFRQNGTAILNLSTSALDPVSTSFVIGGVVPVNTLDFGVAARLGRLSSSAGNTTVVIGAISNIPLEIRTNNTDRFFIGSTASRSDLIGRQATVNIYLSTTDGSDSGTLNLSGGGAPNDNTRGGLIQLGGNEAAGAAGDVNITAGDVSGGNVTISTRNASSSIIYIVSAANHSQMLTGRLLVNLAAGNEATGAGTPQLGTNCPAADVTTPFTWLKFQSADGSLIYVPGWK